jgi:PTS system mannose-specific IIC component
MIDILIYAIIGAFLTLDITAFGQLMVSRPIVCAPLFGYLTGDVKSGLWIGMIVELVWSRAIPMGAAIPHDTTAIAILSVLWGRNAAIDGKWVYVLALMLAAPSGQISRKFDIWVRTLNTGVMHWVERGIISNKESRISKGIFIGVLLFFMKSFIFYLILIPLGNYVMLYLMPYVNIYVREGLNLSWKVLPLTGLAVALVNFHPKLYGKRKDIRHENKKS